MGNGLAEIITILKATSAELKADNDAWEAKALKRFQKNTADKCTCGAYSFPHRVFGGKCEGDDEDESYTSKPFNAMHEAGHKGSNFYEVV